MTKSVPKPGKESVVAASSATKKKSPLSKSLKPESDEEEQPQEVKEVQELAAEEEEKPELESEAETEEAETKEAASKTDAERKAEKLGDAAIEKYWRKLEAQRLAKRVHQEELSTGEKVLRYFDVSSQYGVRLSPLLFSRGRNFMSAGARERADIVRFESSHASECLA